VGYGHAWRRGGEKGRARKVAMNPKACIGGGVRTPPRAQKQKKKGLVLKGGVKGGGKRMKREEQRIPYSSDSRTEFRERGKGTPGGNGCGRGKVLNGLV